MSTRQMPAPWERVYDIHGVRVALRTNSPSVLHGAEQALTDLAWRDGAPLSALADAGAPQVQMEVREQQEWAPVPPEAQPQFRHAEVRCYRHGEQLWYTNCRSTMVLDPARGVARGNVTPSPAVDDGSWRLRGDAVFTFSLLELLRHRGLFHLHAAGLSRDGRGILLAGNTGAGKSTLTVSLVRSGWDFLSDDAVLLRGNAGGVEALAIPDEFHLDPALAQRFPELAILKQQERYGSGEKRAIHPGEIYARQPVPCCTPSLLLFPQIAPGTTRAEALTPTQALAALIRTSALVLLDERVAASHLDALRRLVSQCRCYWLYHGPDALEDPNCIPEIVEALVGRKAPSA